MKTYISINVVSQSLLLLSAISKHQCSLLTDVKQLRLPYGINCDVALFFANQCDWIRVDQKSLAITETGLQINASFDGISIDTYLWQLILMSYIAACQPIWAKRIPFGRKEAYLFMNEEEQRCFDEAGLMSSIDSNVIKWWDEIAEAERKKSIRGKMIPEGKVSILL